MQKRQQLKTGFLLKYVIYHAYKQKENFYVIKPQAPVTAARELLVPPCI